MRRITIACVTSLIAKWKAILNSIADGKKKNKINVLKEILNEKYRDLKQCNEDIVTLRSDEEIENDAIASD